MQAGMDPTKNGSKFSRNVFASHLFHAFLTDFVVSRKWPRHKSKDCRF